jgi:ribonuclease R
MTIDKDRVAVQYLFSSDPAKTWRAGEIAETLGFHGKQLKRLQGLLLDLTRDGVIRQITAGRYAVGQPDDMATGRLTVVRSGAGYVVNPKTGASIWIQNADQGTALPGDTVTVRQYHAAGDEPRGKVVRVDQRSTRDIVGTLFSKGQHVYVVPLDPAFRQDFAVADVKGAADGDRVVIRLTEWQDRNRAPQGEIVDVIGPADKPSLDTDVVCRQYDLPKAFPQAVIDEAERVAALLAEPGERLDLRDTTILTIDPVKARDFDDALSFSRDDRGRRLLGVHIADVSHFVRMGSALDEEARERATSVYLVDKVIPMLPEQLSNGVCSLRPDEDRLCFSAFLTFDADGKMVGRRFAKTIIRSSLRLNYEQAMAIINGAPAEGLPQQPPDRAVALIREAHALAQQLRQNRMQAGALDLEVPECEVLLDGTGRMTRIRINPSDASHQMIEECMVAANEAVATELASRGIKILSRLHEPPDPEKIDELQAALTLLGFKPGDLSNPQRMARFLAESADHPLKHHAHTLVLRSMKRAIYSADAAGHFGLAKQWYSHFTSPIRRYPDLVLHRQLASYLTGQGSKGALPAGYLTAAATHSTEMEQRADDASRALIEIKKYRFLQQQLDDEKPVVYDAVVSRVTNFGIFLDVTELQLTALVHVSLISDQFVSFNPSNETLNAGGTVYRVGTPVKAFVCKVDFIQRRADFALVREAQAADTRGDKKRPPPPHRRGEAHRNTATPAAKPHATTLPEHAMRRINKRTQDAAGPRLARTDADAGAMVARPARPPKKTASVPTKHARQALGARKSGGRKR